MHTPGSSLGSLASQFVSRQPGGDERSGNREPLALRASAEAARDATHAAGARGYSDAHDVDGLRQPAQVDGHEHAGALTARLDPLAVERGHGLDGSAAAADVDV